MPHKIILSVEGGVVHAASGIPAGVELEIRDADIEGVSADRITVIDGERVVVSTYTSDAAHFPPASNELWGVLNAIRVVLRFSSSSPAGVTDRKRCDVYDDLLGLLPRLDEVLAKDSNSAHVDGLLRRAHDMMSGVRDSDTFADCSDLVDDIRLHLHLDLVDCNDCSEVVSKCEAVIAGGIWRCPTCAKHSDSDSEP